MRQLPASFDGLLRLLDGLGQAAHLGEDLGAAMAHRALDHVLQYGEPGARRAVPLALALLNASSPGAAAVDALSRLSHDADADVARAAVLALGIVGAGTNNARLAALLRGLASYYNKVRRRVSGGGVAHTARTARAVCAAGRRARPTLPLHPSNSHRSRPCCSWFGRPRAWCTRARAC